MCENCEQMDRDSRRAAMHAAAHAANTLVMLGCRVGAIDCRRHPRTGQPYVTIQMAPPVAPEFIHLNLNIAAFAGD